MASYDEGVFDTFWFTKNVQGDIVSVYNSSGTKLLTYHYDAWGNVTTQWHTYYGSDYYASYNPFKYRGYYHDSETGFYYLNSRYYDPVTCRFINADGLVSTGQGMLGYNMFAYCNNNPVNMRDSMGDIPSVVDSHNVIVRKIIRKYINDIKEDFYKLDINNEDEEVVFQSNYFSCYKGKLVVKTPFDASFSFGFIGLSVDQQNANTLKHEYGHTLQLERMGIKKYIRNVALPSITINILSRNEMLPYDYYSYPWEDEANRLGGSKLTESDKPKHPSYYLIPYFDVL